MQNARLRKKTEQEKSDNNGRASEAGRAQAYMSLQALLQDADAEHGLRTKLFKFFLRAFNLVAIPLKLLLQHTTTTNT